MQPGQKPVSRYMSASPVTIAPTASMSDAIELMQEHDIRHLPVVEDGRPVGIVSERDLAMARSLVPEGWEEIAVAEAMTPEPYTVSADTPLAAVARRMAESRYGAVLIADGAGQLCGVLTTTDALRALAS